MSFYQSKEGVENYIKIAEGYDGQNLVTILGEHLQSNASVLELGIGPGVDLDLLSARFVVTGSDYSQLFLDRYKATHPEADLILLDAVTIKTDRNFNAIYSNKVLHHLEEDELQNSVQRQHDILKPNGIIMHSFWYGDWTEEHAGMQFHYRNEAFLIKLFSPYFEILQMDRYGELEENDSIFLLGKRT